MAISDDNAVVSICSEGPFTWKLSLPLQKISELRALRRQHSILNIRYLPDQKTLIIFDPNKRFEAMCALIRLLNLWRLRSDDVELQTLIDTAKEQTESIWW